jgi:LysR family glycine cleavage system transcriptional activator
LPLPRIPPLNALRAFKVASLTGSFSQAASELCVSQGAVSRHVAKLEDYLGVKLFDRTNREVRLTEAGARYAAELQIAFEHIERATLDLHFEKKSSRLKIGLFPSLACTWVMEKLQEYQALNPELGLDIVCQTLFSDVDVHALDIMSMNTTSPYDNVEYMPLLDAVLSPVCSSALGERIGRDPRNLKDFTTLHSLRRPDHWSTWLRAAGLPASHCKATRTFENSALALQAAITGMGVAMGLTPLANYLPGHGTLVQPFELKVPLAESYGFAWRPSVLRSKVPRALIDWFKAEKDRRDIEMKARSTAVADRTIATTEPIAPLAVA